MPTRSEQTRAEITRDPIFLLQRAIGNQWHTESVWLTREEAEDYGRANAHNLRPRWQVYCVPAGGELARTLARINPVYQSEPAPARGDQLDDESVRLLNETIAALSKRAPEQCTCGHTYGQHGLNDECCEYGCECGLFDPAQAGGEARP